MLNIVRGDLKNKPVASGQLANFFETQKESFEGTLYIGYPIIGTANGGFQIDAMLITRETGLVAFHINEGADYNIDYQDIQDESYTKIQSKLFQYKELTTKRNLAINITVVTYAPAWSKVQNEDKDYPCIIDNENLKIFIDKLKWNTPEYFEKLLSVLQSITTIRKNKSRNYVKKENSRGFKLKT